MTFLIRPDISNVTPLRITLAKRLLTFRQSIQKLEKDVLKQILNLVESDVRTVTGRNLKGPLKTSQELRKAALRVVGCQGVKVFFTKRCHYNYFCHYCHFYYYHNLSF